MAGHPEYMYSRISVPCALKEIDSRISSSLDEHNASDRASLRAGLQREYMLPALRRVAEWHPTLLKGMTPAQQNGISEGTASLCMIAEGLMRYVACFGLPARCKPSRLAAAHQGRQPFNPIGEEWKVFVWPPQLPGGGPGREKDVCMHVHKAPLISKGAGGYPKILLGWSAPGVRANSVGPKSVGPGPDVTAVLPEGEASVESACSGTKAKRREKVYEFIHRIIAWYFYGYPGDDSMLWGGKHGTARAALYKGKTFAGPKSKPKHEVVHMGHCESPSRAGCINPRHLEWGSHAKNMRMRNVSRDAKHGLKRPRARVEDAHAGMPDLMMRLKRSSPGVRMHVRGPAHVAEGGAAVRHEMLLRSRAQVQREEGVEPSTPAPIHGFNGSSGSRMDVAVAVMHGSDVAA